MPRIGYIVGCLMAVVGIIGIILVVPVKSGYAESASRLLLSPSPVPTLFFPDPLGLGFLFACPDEIVIGPGPTWQGITIGVTTIQELETIFGEPAEVTIMYSTTVSSQFVYGDKVGGCVQNEIIVTLRRGRQMPYLADYVAIYGIPDAVTWTPTYDSRVVFWFDEGLAVEVLTATIDRTHPSWGWVSRTFYFPFQEVTGYEQRWPYNATKPEMPNLAFAPGDPVPTEQNPFDFDAMVATITAQPSRTPTPTFTPHPMQTATPTPVGTPAAE